MAVQDTIKSKTALSLVKSLYGASFDYDMIMTMGCDLIGSRTRLVRQAIALEGTHLLFIDHDMWFPPQKNAITDKIESPIARLLSHNKDVIGVPYNFRSLPLRSTATPLEAKPTDGKYVTTPEELPKGLFQCVALGTGFLLIKLSVFDKIEKPWFNFGRNSDAELVYGEDTFFCAQVMKAGMEVWADGDIEVKHLGEFSY